MQCLFSGNRHVTVRGSHGQTEQWPGVSVWVSREVFGQGSCWPFCLMPAAGGGEGRWDRVKLREVGCLPGGGVEGARVKWEVEEVADLGWRLGPTQISSILWRMVSRGVEEGAVNAGKASFQCFLNIDSHKPWKNYYFHFHATFPGQST